MQLCSVMNAVVIMAALSINLHFSNAWDTTALVHLMAKEFLARGNTPMASRRKVR